LYDPKLASPVITVPQLRAARSLIGRGLAKTAAENVWKVQQALEDAGVIFIDEDEEGPGVRLRKSRD
jgi:hypothetical protein